MQTRHIELGNQYSYLGADNLALEINPPHTNMHIYTEIYSDREKLGPYDLWDHCMAPWESGIYYSIGLTKTL